MLTNDPVLSVIFVGYLFILGILLWQAISDTLFIRTVKKVKQHRQAVEDVVRKSWFGEHDLDYATKQLVQIKAIMAVEPALADSIERLECTCAGNPHWELVKQEWQNYK